MSTPGSYRYSWSSGRYYNDQGNEVTYGEVFVNYIAPNSVDAPYSLFLPGFGSSNEGGQNKRPNSKPVTQRTLAAAIQGVILSKASMMFGGTIYGVLNNVIDPRSFDTPWMDYAVAEYNKVVYILEEGDNERIIEYLKSAGLSGKWLVDETAWCASFIHWCLTEAGIPGAGAKAFDWKSWGRAIDAPAYGAIAIFTWSHVGFVYGMNGNNLIILHGNWSGELRITEVSISSISCYRYPDFYLPSEIYP